MSICGTHLRWNAGRRSASLAALELSLLAETGNMDERCSLGRLTAALSGNSLL